MRYNIFKKLFPAFAVILAILVSACDEGLSPFDELQTRAVFEGTIYFEDDSLSWPDTNEMYGIRVGAFKTDEPSSLIGEVVEGNAYFTLTSLGEYADSLKYKIVVDDAPAELTYLVVAWQYDTTLTAQRVAAVYGGDQQLGLTLNPGDSITGIDFYVDFDNLPPQPF